MAEPAQLVEGPAQLRLEHDDDCDDDEHPGVLEQPREKNEVELRRQRSDHRQQDKTDQDLSSLSPAQEAQELIEHEGDHCHVDELDQTEVVDDLVELEEKLGDHVPAPNSWAITAICA